MVVVSTCPCCGADATEAFRRRVLGRHEAVYASCSCGTLHVVKPHWLEEAYADPTQARRPSVLGGSKTVARRTAAATSPPPPGMPGNVYNVSNFDLIAISRLSERCEAMLARLSAPFIASLTVKNVGRMPRLVLGRPIGCPIWDERDVLYYESIDQVLLKLREVLS